MNMTPEEKRIAIAEACGWLPIGRPDQYDPPMGFPPLAPTVPKNATPLPDYLNSLDAILPAIRELTPKQKEEVVNRIGWSTTRQVFDSSFIANATAAQWSDAFLKTLNLTIPTTPDTP